MIQLTMYKKADGNYTGFSCEGHAGYDEYGQDIVCAGVSTLVITIINSIDTLTSDEMYAEVKEDTGSVTCTFKNALSKEAALLLDALLLGVRGIQEEYGNEYISITYKEVR